MNKDLVKAIETEAVFDQVEMEKTAGLKWHEHPSFVGVALKHLVTGKKTEGKFSSHLVRVKKGCEIGWHNHAAEWELHEVIKGEGQCRMEKRNIIYKPGVSAVIPAKLVHCVQAGEEDLYLLAKFVPALL
ncbi:cupin domain-containing protein [Azotosporobacter soli]|uniref:cupin domain-containing protein n=1 Tax=Azotosporobacter soli TaxID=3055040 RepID=UPI0031FEA474